MSISTSTRRLPSPDHGIQRVDWEDGLGAAFINEWGRRNGTFEPEHLTVYGKSGSGKSYFVGYVLKQRADSRGSFTVILATKKTDKTISALGWPILSKWPPGYDEEQVIYWARAKGLDPKHRTPQRDKVRELLEALWVPQSNVVIYFDELPYIENMLGLRGWIETYYREGRANGITCVASMQRPAKVSREAHSEAGWTAAFPPKDVDDRTRVAEVLGDRRRFSAALDDLDRTKHEFLLRDDRTGEVYITHLPDPRKSGRLAVSRATRAGISSRR